MQIKTTQHRQHSSAQSEHQHDLGCEESVDLEMELLRRGTRGPTGTTDHAERCSSAAETTEKDADTALLSRLKNI